MLRLDDRDIAILSILSREGRITKAALAARVNLSPSPCWERLHRLERAGLIAAYRAEIAPAAFGPHVTVFVTVELAAHGAGELAVFEADIVARPEITGCWALGGGFDYLMQVTVADIDSYQRLIDRMLDAGLGLRRYYSYVVTKQVKAPAPPLHLLAAPTE